MSKTGGCRRGCSALFAANLVLSFPVALVQYLDRVLERREIGRLTDSGELVFKTVWEPFIILAGERHVVPAGFECVPVEVQGITDCFPGVSVPEVF